MPKKTALAAGCGGRAWARKRWRPARPSCASCASAAGTRSSCWWSTERGAVRLSSGARGSRADL